MVTTNQANGTFFPRNINAPARTLGAHLGSKETAKLVARLREADIDFRFEDLLLCVSEPHFGEPGHDDLVDRLQPMWRFEPDFVAVCGYSFASQDPTTGLVYDDHESLRLFVERFKDFAGPVFVPKSSRPRASRSISRNCSGWSRTANIRELVFRKISLQRALVVSAESTTR